MLSIIKSEIYRLRYSFKTIITAILLSVAIVTLIFCVVLISDYRGPTDFIAFNLAKNFLAMVTNAIYFICIALASIIFSSDFSDQTIKNYVNSGQSRRNIFGAKLIVAIATVVALSIVLSALVISSMSLAVVIRGNPEFLKSMQLAKLLYNFLFITFFCIQFIILYFALVLFSKSNGFLIGMAIGLTIGLPLVYQIITLIIQNTVPDTLGFVNYCFNLFPTNALNVIYMQDDLNEIYRILPFNILLFVILPLTYSYFRIEKMEL